MLRNLFVKEDWIAQESENNIWLPHDMRSCGIAVGNNLLVFGHRSGIVSFLGVPSS